MGNRKGKPFESVESENPYFSQTQLIQIINVKSTELSGKALAIWILGMVPLINNALKGKNDIIKIIKCLIGVSKLVDKVQQKIQVAFIRQLQKAIAVHFEMIEKFPDQIDKRLVEINLEVKHRRDYFQKLSNEKEHICCFISFFLFLRCLKTFKTNCDEKLKKEVDDNLLFFKNQIISRRIGLIVYKNGLGGIEPMPSSCVDYFLDYQLTQWPTDGSEYKLKVKESYAKYLKIY